MRALRMAVRADRVRRGLMTFVRGCRGGMAAAHPDRCGRERASGELGHCEAQRQHGAAERSGAEHP